MKLELKDIPEKLAEVAASLKRYAVVLFLVLVAGVYAFLMFRINNLQTAQPDTVSGASKVTTVVTPHIDPQVLQQLQQLQDNSVSVKTLFDQARSNPFQD